MPLAVARKIELPLDATGTGGGPGRSRYRPATSNAITLAQAVNARAPDIHASGPAASSPRTHSPAARPTRMLARISEARRFHEISGNEFSSTRLSATDAKART